MVERESIVSDVRWGYCASAVGSCSAVAPHQAGIRPSSRRLATTTGRHL